MIKFEQLVDVFESANKTFLSDEKSLLNMNVNERTLCGALMLHIHDQIKGDSVYMGYYTDVEYNRNKGSIKTAIKTINGPDYKVLRINCDLIVHSRGERPTQDNLIAIEMKKSNRPVTVKNDDRYRLKALTKDSFDDVWSFDGHTLPKHVCRYVLGIYYEINIIKHEVLIEYYCKGEMVTSYNLNY